MADYAILCAGAWSVPIYPTLPAGQIAPLLNDSGAQGDLRLERSSSSARSCTIRAQCPQLDHVILMDGNPPREPGYTTFHEVVDRGRPDARDEPGRLRAARRRASSRRTSPRSSTPRARPASPRARCSPTRTSSPTSSPAARSSRSPADAVALSFLPLSHVFERMLDYAYFYGRASIAYAESIDKLGGELPRGQPALLRRRAARLREGARPDPGRRPRRAARSRGRSSPGRSAVGRERVAVRRARRAAAGGARAARRRSPTRSCFRKIRAALGSRLPVRGLGRRAALARPRRVLRRRRRPDLRGLRPDRDLARDLRQRARALAARHGRQAAAGRRGEDRRRRRDPDARPARHEGLLQQARGDGGGDRRGRLVPHRRHRQARRDGFLVDHRPQEGPDRAGRRQEGRAAADRERAQAVSLHRRCRSSSATARSSWRPSSSRTSTGSGSGRRRRGPTIRTTRSTPTRRPRALPGRDRRVQRATSRTTSRSGRSRCFRRT